MIRSLDGIRVLELARYQAGPRGGMMMSDLGAEVIKIERIGGEDTRNNAPIMRGQSVYFSVYNRGKKSLCLDMRSDEGKQELQTELAHAIGLGVHAVPTFVFADRFALQGAQPVETFARVLEQLAGESAGDGDGRTTVH